MMHQFWRLGEAGPDNLGLACTDDGLLLGRTPLIEWRDARFAVRDRGEIERLLKHAFSQRIGVEWLMPGLATVAFALNANDPCLARIAAVHLKIPDLPSFSARGEMEAEDLLIKSDWNPDLHPRTGTPPNPGWFAATGGSESESSSAQMAQNDDVTLRSDGTSSTGGDRVQLAAGERNDELGDLLEWIANVNPEDERAIRSEVKRLYLDVGDKLGYDALNAALSDVLDSGGDRKDRQNILDQIAPYANTDPARGQSDEYLTAATLLVLGIAPPGMAVDTAAAAWSLGWAARGIYFSERLGANLPTTFPVIDSFLDGVATSIKSIDLNAAIYQDATRLTYRLNTYIDEMALFEGAELGDMEIRSTDITSRVLSLAIPKQGTTAAQKAAIEAAQLRAQAFDVNLIITQF